MVKVELKAETSPNLQFYSNKLRPLAVSSLLKIFLFSMINNTLDIFFNVSFVRNARVSTLHGDMNFQRKN